MEILLAAYIGFMGFLYGYGEGRDEGQRVTEERIDEDLTRSLGDRNYRICRSFAADPDNYRERRHCVTSCLLYKNIDTCKDRY